MANLTKNLVMGGAPPPLSDNARNLRSFVPPSSP